jgi:hypothetical protein
MCLMNPSEANLCGVALQAVLFLVVWLCGLSIVIAGAAGPRRLMRGVGRLAIPFFAVVFRGIVILTLLGIVYLLLVRHRGEISEFFKSLPAATTRHAP